MSSMTTPPPRTTADHRRSDAVHNNKSRRKKGHLLLYASIKSRSLTDTDSTITSIRGGASPKAGEHQHSYYHMDTIRIGCYVCLWYCFSVAYNVANKKVLQAFPAPLTIGTLQFAMAGILTCLLWLIRMVKRPHLTTLGRSTMTTLGLTHSLGQSALMTSLMAPGPVACTHSVKALEPLVTALIAGWGWQNSSPNLSSWMYVYASMLPIVVGAMVTTQLQFAKEMPVSAVALGAAMASNIAFAYRGVLSKSVLSSSSDSKKNSTTNSMGENLTPTNVCGLMSFAAMVISIPIAFLGEGTSLEGLWETALKTTTKESFLQLIGLSGMLSFFSNVAMYHVLWYVHPVTVSIGNTLRRLVVLVVSALVFRNKLSQRATIGSTIGLWGGVLYMMAMDHHHHHMDGKVGKKKSVKKAASRSVPQKR